MRSPRLSPDAEGVGGREGLVLDSNAPASEICRLFIPTSGGIAAGSMTWAKSIG